MTGNAINATSDELTSEQLDAVSGGFYDFGGYATLLRMVASIERGGGGGAGGQNDPAQMFAQILQQMTQGG